MIAVATTADIPVNFAGLTSIGTIPRWASGFNARRTTLDALSHSDLSGVVVVQAKGLEQIEKEHDRMTTLASHLWKSADPVRLVLELSSLTASPDALDRVLRLFAQSVSRVELAYGTASLQGCLFEALTKYLIEKEQETNDPLAEAREVIEATRPLLAESGRLSVKAIAAVFNIPWTRLARQIGSTKQAVDKTPDSVALQSALRPYERVARLRAIFKDADFRAWLNRQNVHLDNHTPLGLIEDGRVAIVADLVESMLTGTPS